MIKLLKANLARLWKNKVFWLGFLVLNVFCIIQKIGLIQDTIEVHYLEETFWIQAYVLGIILSVFISLFIGAEYEYGTIRNKIISGYDRSEIYLANIFACIIAGWIMCMGCLISSLLVGVPFLGFFHTELSEILLLRFEIEGGIFMLLPWVLCSILSFIVLILCVKIHTLKVGMAEIRVQLADWLKTDTNTLISISSSDRQMRLLASDLNRQLRLLRRQRRRYLDGDRELKDAVTNISHDLRTPLTAICGYLDLLRNEEKSEKVTHYVMAIQNRAEVLKQLTEELFRYSIIMSAQEPMQLEPLCVNDMLEQSIVSFYATLTKRGITPQIDITEKKIMRTILGTLADWGIGERGETSKT